MTSSLYAGSLQWVIFSFSPIAFSQVNYEDLVNSCLSPISSYPTLHSNSFEVSVHMSWFNMFKPQTFKCWVSILWYLISIACNNYFINILIFTFFYLATCCGRLYIFNTNEIYLDNLPYLFACLLACLLSCLPAYLLTNSNNTTMEMKRLRTLAVEIFKALNEINPPYVKNIFTPKENPKARHNDIMVKHINTSRFGTQRLTTLGPRIWNNLASNIKSEISFWTEVQVQCMHKHLNRKCFFSIWVLFHKHSRKCRLFVQQLSTTSTNFTDAKQR